MTPQQSDLMLVVLIMTFFAALLAAFASIGRKELTKHRFKKWVSGQCREPVVLEQFGGDGPELLIFAEGRTFAVWFTDTPSREQRASITTLRDQRFRCVASLNLTYLQKDFCNGNSLHRWPNARHTPLQLPRL